ncbi:hypothetical protein HELRODRAFT_163974 [Helobdella robusta]|uniref:Uncharacterized protein n=1 Tax=Helobdella robusta TaxID=6412 RepID=T1EUP6_HELRO|nr:hypothetical protein HELRODRAFT_163974 [Helobdella robusta]ESN94185.1 hypothetical protein HELRODRAFT_163974 [Helobdella robusta]
MLSCLLEDQVIEKTHDAPEANNGCKFFEKSALFNDKDFQLLLNNLKSVAYSIKKSFALQENLLVWMFNFRNHINKLHKSLVAEWLACPSITPTTRVRILQFLQVHSGSRLPVNPAVHPSETYVMKISFVPLDDTYMIVTSTYAYHVYKCALATGLHYTTRKA